MGARVLVAVLLATAGLASPAAAAPTLKKGELSLKPCGDVKGWWCGSLPRALDPAKPNGPHIGIDFRWRPPGGKARGPALVAVEGGPGYPSTGSRVEYAGIYGAALLKRRGLLLVDNRGTGTSDLIDCKEVQDFAGVNTTTAFAKRVEACARQLERRHPGVHAADLYATAYAVNDLAAVIEKLKLGRVDLYGDSYGTFFSQSFMARHPDLLHSVVLDSAYPVRDLDPWYVSSATVARSAMDAVCARDPGCAASAPGSATARLGQLLAKLRTGAIAGRTRDADASSVRARVGLREVVDMVQDAGSDPVIYRELDASVRAALAGDNAPLLRLVAQSRTWSHGTSDPGYFSNGLYWAVACMDYPQLWTPQSSFARRREQLAAAIAARQPLGSFDPFTTDEWLLMSAYSQPFQGCLRWLRPAHTAPVVPAKAVPLPATVPVLIVGGDVDSLTPLSDARVFGPTLGAKVRVVTLANTVHVTSEGDTYLVEGADCGRRIIRAFVRAPAKLDAIDASCGAQIPPIHTPGAYPVRLADAAPATVAAGADPGATARQAVTVAAGALADATIRRYYSGVARGPGLRGGSFTVKEGSPLRFTLRKVRFVSDATVSGTGTWRFSNGAIAGTLTVTPATGAAVRVKVSWRQRSRLATATVGTSTLSLPAP